MGDVIKLQMITKLDIPPDSVLTSALGQLESVVIMGYTKDSMEYFASSFADGGEVLWLAERLKHILITSDYDEE